MKRAVGRKLAEHFVWGQCPHRTHSHTDSLRLWQCNLLSRVGSLCYCFGAFFFFFCRIAGSCLFLFFVVFYCLQLKKKNQNKQTSRVEACFCFFLSMPNFFSLACSRGAVYYCRVFECREFLLKDINAELFKSKDRKIFCEWWHQGENENCALVWWLIFEILCGCWHSDWTLHSY